MNVNVDTLAEVIEKVLPLMPEDVYRAVFSIEGCKFTFDHDADNGLWELIEMVEDDG